MKAVVFEQAGEAEHVLKWREDVPLPQPGDGEVQVRVTARAIQPADRLFIAGRYSVQPRFPQVAGFDAAGFVSAVGSKVHGLEVGQRVAFRSAGAWGEFAVAPTNRVYPVPPELSGRLSDEVVCQFPLNPLTAWGLLDMTSQAAGLRVLVTAAKSVVAGVLVELASRRGMVVERLVRDGDDYRLSNAQGVTLASGAEIAQVLAQSQSYDVILDPVGGPATATLMDKAVQGGQLISYGVLDDRAFEIKASKLLYRNLTWQGFAITSFLNRSTPDKLSRAFAECWDVLAHCPQLLPVAGRFALAEFLPALRCAEQSTGEGKVVLC